MAGGPDQLGRMSGWGQSRHFGRRQTTSGLPPGNGHSQGDPAHPKSASFRSGIR
jgi:hypothetical protein